MAESSLPMDAEHVAQLDRRHVLHTWTIQGEAHPLVVTGGKGSCFYDGDGAEWLDFHSQWAYLTVGHGHPKIIDAIISQLQILPVAAPSYATAPAAKLAKMIADLTPGDLSKVLFVNSGSEANECAVRIARSYTGRPKVITRYRSFHGNTYGAGTLSGDPRRLPLEPGIPGVVRALDCYCYRCWFGKQYPECRLECAEHIGQIIELEGWDQVAAVLVEPVVASNGGLVPPPEYLPRLREICDRYGVLLIADEVVTGFGRTGRWFGCDHWNVTPDIMAFAKGVNSAYLPLGGVVVRKPIADYFESHFLNCGMTTANHPTSCAAGVATIEVLREERLLENSQAMGKLLMEGLQNLAVSHPSVGEARGLGLYAVLELVRNRQTREPLVPWVDSDGRVEKPTVASGPMLEVKARLRERHVEAAYRWNRIHIAPPLCITAAEIQRGLDALDYALGAADAHCA